MFCEFNLAIQTNSFSDFLSAVVPEGRCRTLQMSRSWECLSCICWLLCSDIWPSTVSKTQTQGHIRAWMSSKHVTTHFIVQCQVEIYSEAVFVLNGGVSVRAHRIEPAESQRWISPRLRTVSQVLRKSQRRSAVCRSRNRTSCLMFLC